MRFEPLRIAGTFRVQVEPIEDERGFFARAWCADELAAHGVPGVVAQMNVSTNVRAGTIRGLHYQLPPHEETKFFRCIAGRTWHAVVDLRPDSTTSGEWLGVELAADRFDALVVSAGCATGYQALTDGAAVIYAASAAYAPGAEQGVRHDDPGLAITWPLGDAIVSVKDRAWPDLELPSRGTAPASASGASS